MCLFYKGGWNSLYYWILLGVAIVLIFVLQIKKRQANQKAEHLLMTDENLAKVYFFFKEGKISAYQFAVLAVNGQKPTMGEDLSGAYVLVPSGKSEMSIQCQYLGLKGVSKKQTAEFQKNNFTSKEVFPIEKNRVYMLVLNPDTNRPALQIIL